MNLLVIEDSEVDFEMLVCMLATHGIRCDAHRVETVPGLAMALSAKAWDLVVSDHQLPGFSSIEALEIVRSHTPPPPFIIVSGRIGEELAVEAMRRGADDYLMKGNLARLGVAVRNALAAAEARREKAAAEKQLRLSQLQLRNLSGRLQAMIDEERNALAREIHDEVGAALTAVRFDLDTLDRHVGDALRPRVARAQQALRQAMTSAQQIMRNLRPPILDAGLAAALEWQLDEFRDRTGIDTRLNRNTDALNLPMPLAMAAYRTCQEALTNVAKHSGAASVDVELLQFEGVLSLEIRDDGRGLQPEDLQKPASLGLRGLKERAHAAGGSLDVASVPGGTSVVLRIPVAPQFLAQVRLDDTAALAR
jgi:signal transduction histidine kinase